MEHRFTKRAEGALNNSLQLASGLGHTYIGSEHLLLALAKEKDSLAAFFLEGHGLSGEKIENAIADFAGTGTKTEITVKDMTPRTRRIIELSGKTADTFHSSNIGTEHILLSLLGERESVAVRLLSSLGIAVYNAHTAFSVYEAIELGKPLIERYMTLSGRAAKNPCNLLVKIGTPFALLAERCEASDTRMVVSGGPMMGFCSVSGEVCTKKTSGSLLFFTKEEVADSAAPVGACIGCGRCVSVCPMRLMPVMIDQSARAGNLKDAARYGAQQCMECGSCSYVCPAKRPLMQSIRGTKKKLREEKKRG